MVQNANKKTNQTPKQPLFYKDPAPITLERHATAGLATEENYLFSKSANNVPITASEIIEASKDYPVVFTAAKNIEMVAVIGLENNKNLMVNSDGMWAKDKYIPAYVRRYPFAFMQVDEEKLLLCVDESSDRFLQKPKKKDMAFFDGNEQSALTKRALDFCVKYHRDYFITESFVNAVKDAGLLKESQLTVNAKGKQTPYSLSGFMIVDEAKFLNLDSKLLQEWHKSGYLSLIYFHLQSLSNFNSLTKVAK